MIPILSGVETPDFFELELPAGPGGPGAPAPSDYPRRPQAGSGPRASASPGSRASCSRSRRSWAGMPGSGVGVKLAVIGWHTGILGKLVFFIGLAVVALVALRESGFELPPAIPESLVVLALGALAAIFVLIRIISIPDAVLPGRRPRHRDLDQPARRARRDPRRAAARRRRALAPSSTEPRSA